MCSSVEQEEGAEKIQKIALQKLIHWVQNAKFSFDLISVFMLISLFSTELGENQIRDKIKLRTKEFCDVVCKKSWVMEQKTLVE